MEQINEAIQSASRRVSEDKRLLPCKLSDMELIERGQELADQVNAIQQEEAEQTNQKKAMRDKLTGMTNELERIAKIVDAREETRPVVVVGELVATAEGQMVRETRTDTGEVLLLRQATGQELQPGFNL